MPRIWLTFTWKRLTIPLVRSLTSTETDTGSPQSVWKRFELRLRPVSKRARFTMRKTHHGPILAARDGKHAGDTHGEV